MTRQRLVTILGFVDPYGTDEQGNVTCVSVAGEGRRYVILPRGKGRALTQLVDTEAQVSGFVRRVDGVEYLDVLSFEAVCLDPVDYDDHHPICDRRPFRDHQ